MGVPIKKVNYTFTLSPLEADCLDEALSDVRSKYLKLGMKALVKEDDVSFEWTEARGLLIQDMIDGICSGSEVIQEEEG